MENAKKSITTILLAASVLLIWGLNWPLVKLSLTQISPQILAFTRVFIAFIFFTLIMLFTKQIKWPKKTDWPIVLTVGLNQVGLYIFLIGLGVSYVDANRCAILAYSTPLFVMPIAFFVLGQRPTIWKATGVAIGFIGIMIMFSPFDFDFSNEDNLKGNALIIGSAFIWAIQIIFIKAYRHDYSPFKLLPWQLGLSSLMLVTFALESNSDISSWYVDMDLTTFVYILFIGILGTGYAFWGILQLNRILDANTLSIIILLTPISGFIFSILILKETILLSNIIGLTTILLGTIVSMGDHFKKRVLK